MTRLVTVVHRTRRNSVDLWAQLKVGALLQCIDFFSSISACLWHRTAYKWGGDGELLHKCLWWWRAAATVFSYCLQLLIVFHSDCQSFHRKCWANNVHLYLRWISVTKDADLSNKRVGVKPLKCRCCVVLSVKWFGPGFTLGGAAWQAEAFPGPYPWFGIMVSAFLQKLKAEPDPTATAGSRHIAATIGKRA